MLTSGTPGRNKTSHCKDEPVTLAAASMSAIWSTSCVRAGVCQLFRWCWSASHHRETFSQSTDIPHNSALSAQRRRAAASTSLASLPRLLRASRRETMATVSRL